ncbi:MAG: alpha/beta hydrolase [Eubacterium sp.]|nr:alpha/beta hydrolase [Candidatus Colimonas fimequi]
MIKFWDVRIPPLTGREKRKAYIYVPDSYSENLDLRYPVLYMFDGHNVFFDSHATYDKSWGMMEYLEKTQTQLIVAAVECNHSPDHGRLKEYSPYDFNNGEYGAIKGLGETTLRWFVNKFKPFIDKKYPTIPEREFTFIGGSSMGGLMSLYALFKYNDVFSAALSMSPSIWVAPIKLTTLINNTEIDPVTDLYIDCGESEVSSLHDKLNLYYDIIDVLNRKGVCVTHRMVPNGTHCEASWEKQLEFAIPALMYRTNRLEEQIAASAEADADNFADDYDEDNYDANFDFIEVD